METLNIYLWYICIQLKVGKCFSRNNRYKKFDESSHEEAIVFLKNKRNFIKNEFTSVIENDDENFFQFSFIEKYI